LLLFAAILLLAAIGALTWRASPDAAPPSDADRQLEEAVTAFRLLVEHYVEPPDPSLLLTAGWTGARDAVGRRVPDVLDAPAPRYAGDVPRDEARFRKGLKELLDQSKGEITPEELAQAAIAAMARSLGDNHTAFIPAVIWQRIRAGERQGPGYSAVPVAAGSLVWEVLPGSDAERGGLQPGDVIIAFQDPSERGEGPGVDPLRPMPLTVQRPSGTVQLQVTGERSEFDFFDWELIDRDVAYVRVRSFLSYQDRIADYYTFMDTMLTLLIFTSPDAWIIDLRNNPGGSSGGAALLARRMGLTGPLMEAVDRDGTSSLVSGDAQNLIGDSPIVILVNQRSFSAAEIFAAALQDAGRAYIIGEKTGGAVKGSERFEVAGGGLIMTTKRVYAGANRHYLDKIGVTPDRVVQLDPESLQQARTLGSRIAFFAESPAGFGAQKSHPPNRDGYDSHIQAALDYLRPLLQR